MKEDTRQSYLNDLVAGITKHLKCTEEFSHNLVACSEGFKLRCLTTDTALGYLRQLMLKEQVIPTDEAISLLTEYLGVRSIFADVPDDVADIYLNPDMPFVSHISYEDADTLPIIHRDGALVKSKMHEYRNGSDQKLARFFYIEHRMPKYFYSCCHKQDLESVLGSGLAGNHDHPIRLWSNTESAIQDKSTSLKLSLKGSSPRDGSRSTDFVAVAVDSNYLHRNPDIFSPLHLHSRMLCMKYADHIEPKAISVS